MFIPPLRWGTSVSGGASMSYRYCTCSGSGIIYSSRNGIRSTRRRENHKNRNSSNCEWKAGPVQFNSISSIFCWHDTEEMRYRYDSRGQPEFMKPMALPACQRPSTVIWHVLTLQAVVRPKGKGGNKGSRSRSPRCSHSMACDLQMPML